MEFYKNKICVITGAASGIGKAISELLVESEAIVILVDKNEIIATASNLPNIVEAKICDVSDLKQVKGLVDYVLNKYGRIDYMFNNAGIAIAGEARDIDMDDWNKTLAVNLNGVINGVAGVYPIMARQGFGHIINTASIAGLFPVTMEIPYVTSKFAVVGLSHALRMEGKNLGVKVTVVCPSGVDTNIWVTSKVVGSKLKTPINFLKSMFWFPKLITPEKAAGIILKGVSKNKATILTDFSSRLGWYCYKIFPNLWMQLYESYTMRNFRKMRAVNE